MAAEIADLSATDASNIARFPESQAPSTVNDGARALEGLIARGLKDTIDGALTTGGTTTAYTCTLNRSSIAAWYTGLQFTVKWNATCGAAPTINPTGSGALGAKSLYWPDGTQVAAGDLVANSVGQLYYDGTNVQVLSMSLVVFPARFIASDAITAAKIAINSVDGTKIALGSDAQGDVMYYDGTNWARLGVGTSGHFLKTQGAAANPVWASAAGVNDMLLYQDRKANTTIGNAYTAGGYRTGILNTEVTDTGSIGSIAANQVTLAAGSYEFVGFLNPGYNAGNMTSRLRLQDITAGSPILAGPNLPHPGAGFYPPPAVIAGSFILAIQSVLELQVYPSATTTGAVALSAGDDEVYASLAFRRYAT